MLHSDYNLPKLGGIVSMTKIKNEIARSAPTLTPKISNIRVNGQLQGCSGFITDPATGRVVYISTDVNHQTVRQALFRTARNDRDFTGGTNRWCALDAAEIIESVVELFAQDRAWAQRTSA